ncbi:hypothetical protein [Okeania sp. SIO3B5]|uniref:hypothetical protein n=1 Tax=Okeania sp. SIO3B5 TaxID=2607811 RepID=UPI0025DCE7FF|nr:hypothetical protein [Okeania sp. SIO3B5]
MEWVKEILTELELIVDSTERKHSAISSQLSANPNYSLLLRFRKGTLTVTFILSQFLNYFYLPQN